MSEDNNLSDRVKSDLKGKREPGPPKEKNIPVTQQKGACRVDFVWQDDRHGKGKFIEVHTPSLVVKLGDWE